MFFQKTQHASSFNTAPQIHHGHPRGFKRESRLLVGHFDQREKSNPPPLEEISRSAGNDWTVALPQSRARATMALDLFAETKGLS